MNCGERLALIMDNVGAELLDALQQLAFGQSMYPLAPPP